MNIVRHRGRCTKLQKYYPPYKNSPQMYSLQCTLLYTYCTYKISFGRTVHNYIYTYVQTVQTYVCTQIQ